MRVERADEVARALGLGAADVDGAVDHLPLKIADADRVVVDDADGADARCGEIRDHRAAETARADDQHLRRLELLLARSADARAGRDAAHSGASHRARTAQGFAGQEG